MHELRVLLAKRISILPTQQRGSKPESGAFMNRKEWVREFKHPYKHFPDAAETHGHLKPTSIPVPPYSTFAVPFWWMLRSNQKTIQENLGEQLPPDEEPWFPTGWVFGRARQEALVELFFNKRSPKMNPSLCSTAKPVTP
jgi:hypothetical protein